MLISSENTCICVLVILYEVLIRGNHAGGGKVLLKKSCHEITPPAAKARFAQVLRIRRGLCRCSAIHRQEDVLHGI